MAYFISQAGAGLTNGSSPENAKALASVAWGAVGKEIYLIGTFTSTVTVSTATGTAEAPVNIYGNYPNYECTITTGSGSGISANGVHHHYYGITLDNCALHGFAPTIASAKTGLWIKNCTINNCSAGIRLLQTITGITQEDIIIDGNTITNNSSSGIRMTIEGAAEGLSFLKDITITNNTITGNGDDGIIVGNSGFDAPYNEKVTITGNTIRNNLGGGLRVYGWLDVGEKSVIANNDLSANYDVTGGLNLLYGENFDIYNNTCNDNVAFEEVTQITPSIDANGILIDNGCKRVRLYGNECSRNVGNSTYSNTGAGIMILAAENVIVSGNYGTGNREGIYIGGQVGNHVNITINNNSFIENNIYGIYVDNNLADDGYTVYNNVFTGATGNTAAYREMESGTLQTGDDYNYFYGFTAQSTIARTFGSNTVFSTDPNLYVNYVPDSAGVLYRAGKTTTFGLKDFNGNKFKNPPTIGAYEFTSGSVALDRTQVT